MVPFPLMCWPLSHLPVVGGRHNPKYSINTTIFAVGLNPVAKPGDSNRCYLLDWRSLSSFEKRMPCAERGGMTAIGE